MSLLLDTNVVFELRKRGRMHPRVGLTREHADRILPVDRRVTEEWGRLSAARGGSPVDVLMAATARVHELVLVTRNVRHVAWTGVSCLNPFDART